MKETAGLIINSLVGDESTQILEEIVEDKVILTIDPKPENFGKIIGKKGKIINAVRKLLRIRAAKEGVKIFIRVGKEDQFEKGSVLTEELNVATGASTKET